MEKRATDKEKAEIAWLESRGWVAEYPEPGNLTTVYMRRPGWPQWGDGFAAVYLAEAVRCQRAADRDEMRAAYRAAITGYRGDRPTAANDVHVAVFAYLHAHQELWPADVVPAPTDEEDAK